ncbi:YlbE-like family protein [Terrihalobacillus insolitus]|nr:YlbE-like family protein [Terrihalobacillus insolitus]
MQPSLYYYLRSRSDLLHFIRMHPDWYRSLTRDPSQIQVLEEQAKVFYGRTLPQKIEKFGGKLQMVSMLMQLAGSTED